MQSVIFFVSHSQVPYEDLRYLFGEIMYGGHITDDWDRRLCSTYLEEFVKAEMMDRELLLAPGFPLPGNMDFNSYHEVSPPQTLGKRTYYQTIAIFLNPSMCLAIEIYNQRVIRHQN